MRNIRLSLEIVFNNWGYRIIGLTSFLFFSIVYFFVLPSTYTGGHIGFISIQYLTLKLAVIALILALFLSLIIPLTMFLIRRGERSNKSATAGGVIVGLLTPLLCCSPIIPVVIGLLGAILPVFVKSHAIFIQAFIATHEMLLYGISLLLLIIALYRNAKCIVSCEL